jgi:hypothetical protein
VDATPLRVGVIGCGFFTENHLAAWSSMDDVVLAAVCDIDLEKARSAAERHKAEAYYGDAAEMLAREQLDFVDIATTMESHASLVALAASRKLPTIVQKPPRRPSRIASRSSREHAPPVSPSWCMRSASRPGRGYRFAPGTTDSGKSTIEVSGSGVDAARCDCSARRRLSKEPGHDQKPILRPASGLACASSSSH